MDLSWKWGLLIQLQTICLATASPEHAASEAVRPPAPQLCTDPGRQVQWRRGKASGLAGQRGDSGRWALECPGRTRYKQGQPCYKRVCGAHDRGAAQSWINHQRHQRDKGWTRGSMLDLGQSSWWSQMRVTQFQGHPFESRKVTHNALGRVCGSVAWVDVHKHIYSYRGTNALVERRYLLQELFFPSMIHITISYETFVDCIASLLNGN